MKRIVALVDHSVYAPSVCDHAAWLAESTTSTIDVVHVVNPVDVVAMRRAGMAGLAVGGPGLVGEIIRHGDDRMEELTAKGQELVDHLTGRIAPKAGVALGRVLVGELSAIVEAMDGEADVIVVGKRGEGADFVGLSLGSNLERIVRGTGCPLLIAPRTFRSITGWVFAFSPEPYVASALRRTLMSDLLPKLPCELIYAGEPSEATRQAIRSAQEFLADQGMIPTTVTITDGRPVSSITNRMVSEDLRLIAVGDLRTRWLPGIFGEGTGTELTKASLAAVLLLR